MSAAQPPSYRLKVIKSNHTKLDEAYVGEFDFITIPRVGDIIAITEPSGPNSFRTRQGRVTEVFLHGRRPEETEAPIASVHAQMED